MRAHRAVRAGLAGALAAGLTASAQAPDPPATVDRLQAPQKLVVEIFHMRGVPRLQVEQTIEGRKVSLASLFAPGGIEVELRFRDDAPPLQFSPTSDAKTLLAFAQRARKASAPSEWSGAIVVVNGDAGRAGILSQVLDDGRTAAIFAEANKAAGPRAALWMFRNAAHEVTHFLNLHHADWEGESFTSNSTIEGYAPAESMLWRLSAASLVHLRHESDQFVRPGGVPFGTIRPAHALRHQKIPDEGYKVVELLPTIAGSPAPDPLPVQAAVWQLGPVITPFLDLPGAPERSTTQDKISVVIAVAGMGADLTEIRVIVRSPDGQDDLEVAFVRSPAPRKQALSPSIPLRVGRNTIVVTATDKAGRRTEELLDVVREDVPPKLLAVVIGVQDYQNVTPLKHTLEDARAMRDRLLALGVLPDRLLYKENPDLRTLRSALGTWLGNVAGPRDIALVYFAGHGAARIDSRSSDRDNVSKYLLPVEAELDDLYATALPMKEFADVVQKTRAGTVLVFLDACFSGAAGGRTVVAPEERAATVLDRGFLEAMGNAGRVLISAAGANEAAAERDALGHGVFTYFLLQALEGKANLNDDETVDHLELFSWVSDQVKKETQNKQNPGLFGEVSGRVPLWRRPAAQ